MQLYYNPLSTYSQKVLMALYEKNVPFTPELVNLMSPEGAAAYQSFYPLGKLPLLKPTPDYMIPESTIIIEYLEGHYGDQGTRLIPEGVDPGRQVRFMDRMSDLYLNDPAGMLLFQQLGFAQHTEAALDKARRQLTISYGHFDKRLSGSEWICGAFSMADCAAIPPLFYAQIVAPFGNYVSLSRYFERAQKRASYARVLAEFLPMWNSLQSPQSAVA